MGTAISVLAHAHVFIYMYPSILQLSISNLALLAEYPLCLAGAHSLSTHGTPRELEYSLDYYLPAGYYLCIEVFSGAVEATPLGSRLSVSASRLTASAQTRLMPAIVCVYQ